jgi:hypothetical protein
MRRPAASVALAAVAALLLAGGACSSDSTTTSTGSNNSSPASEPATSSNPVTTRVLPGLESGDHLVVAAPSEQEPFAKLVAITVDDTGIPLVAYVNSPSGDTDRPRIYAASYDAAAGHWRDTVEVGQIATVRGVLRLTSGASETVTATFEADADSATFTSSDGGTTWVTAQPLPPGTGDPATATGPDGRTFTVHVVRTCAATNCADAKPGIYVKVSA